MQLERNIGPLFFSEIVIKSFLISTMYNTVHMATHKKKQTRKMHTGKTRKSKTMKHTWSDKYKASINCKKPKGFSQKQHCKHGRQRFLHKMKTKAKSMRRKSHKMRRQTRKFRIHRNGQIKQKGGMTSTSMPLIKQSGGNMFARLFPETTRVASIATHNVTNMKNEMLGQPAQSIAPHPWNHTDSMLL